MDFLSFWNLGIYKDKLKDLDTDYWVNLLKKFSQNSSFSYLNNNGSHLTIDYLIQIPEFKPLINEINYLIQNQFQDPNLNILDMWGNISSPLTQDNIHHHNDSSHKMSGVLYLQTPKNSGNIFFVNPGNLNLKSNFVPSSKDIILFPSYLPHYVGLNLSKKDRISIAFDIS